MTVTNATTAHQFVRAWEGHGLRAARHMTIAIEGQEMARSVYESYGYTEDALDRAEAIGVLRAARLRFRAEAGDTNTTASEPIR
jgi:hypothetical protein